MSEHTESRPWKKATLGMYVTLRHDDYPDVTGSVTFVNTTSTASGSNMLGSVRLGGSWYYAAEGWTLWVEPVSAEDNALFMLAKTIHLGFMGSNDDNVWDKEDLDVARAVRAAGYMTEAEWEAKRPRREPPATNVRVAHTAPDSEYTRGRLDGWDDAREYLAATPEVRKP